MRSTDPADIRNFLRLSPRVTTSGRLEPGDPARLAAMGAGRVINLAMADHPEALPDAAAEMAAAMGAGRVINLAMADHPEALPDAAAEMAAAGLGYTHIPVPWDAPTEVHHRAFVAALEAADQPVHVHCIMNWRVSAMMCRYHIERGMAENEARALMQLVWNPDSSDYPGAGTWAAFVRPKFVRGEAT